MNLYLLSRTDQVGYDEYDAFVVAANDELEAKLFLAQKYDSDDEWSDKVEVKAIGITGKYTEPTEILGSFNAG